MTDHGITFSGPMVDALLAGRKTQTRRLIAQPRACDHSPWRQPLVDGKASIPGITDEFQPSIDVDGVHCAVCGNGVELANGRESGVAGIRLPFATGDRLYVRETYYQFGHWEPLADRLTRGGKQKWGFVPDTEEIFFDPPHNLRLAMDRRDPGTPAWHKRLARFMPRAASRMTLHVSDVRVMRLAATTEGDAIAEGVVAIPRSHDGNQWTDFVVPGVGHPNPDFPYLARPTAREMYAALMDVLHGSGFWLSDPWVAAATFAIEHESITRARSP